MKRITATVSVVLLLAACLLAQNPNKLSSNDGRYNASRFAGWTLQVAGGPNLSGAQTLTMNGSNAQGAGGLVFNPLNVPTGGIFPRLYVIDGANSEAVTPTTISGCGRDAAIGACSVTATFANAHGIGAKLASGSAGLDEAINYVQQFGGMVVIDGTFGGTNATITGGFPYANIPIEDTRNGLQYWNAAPSTASFLAAPTTLTAVTALPSATPVGAFGTGTYFMCVAYVDIAGQEGPCSATFSQAGLATGSFIFTAPAASTGAVGYTIYISLTGGTYSLAYQVPLTSSVCTLTTAETVTPACAVTNANYNQTGATATVTAITVNTSPVDMQIGGVSGTLLTGNPNGRTVYAYTPGARLGGTGALTVTLPFTVGGIGSATPIAMATVNLPAGFMNTVGKQLRVCGKFLNTDVNSSIQNVNIYWDAAASNVAGSPVKIGGLAATGTGTAAAYSGVFCETFTTTVAGAGGTAGSLLPGVGFLEYALVSSGNVVGNGADTLAAAVTLINLAGGGGFSNRLSIVHTNTTGNATPQEQTLTIEVL